MAVGPEVAVVPADSACPRWAAAVAVDSVWAEEGGGGGGMNFGNGVAPFDHQQFDPNLSGLGQRQPDFDFNKRGSDARGGDQKRHRN